MSNSLSVSLNSQKLCRSQASSRRSHGPAQRLLPRLPHARTRNIESLLRTKPTQTVDNSCPDTLGKKFAAPYYSSLIPALQLKLRPTLPYSGSYFESPNHSALKICGAAYGTSRIPTHALPTPQEYSNATNIPATVGGILGRNEHSIMCQTQLFRNRREVVNHQRSQGQEMRLKVKSMSVRV